MPEKSVFSELFLAMIDYSRITLLCTEVTVAVGVFVCCVCAGVSELVRVVIQSGHLLADTIVQGSATSHMVPVDQADGESPPAGQRV